jgi:hypothetical protein
MENALVYAENNWSNIRYNIEALSERRLCFINTLLEERDTSQQAEKAIVLCLGSD